MEYKNDVFISFSHIDNQRISERFDGWITRFHKVLATFLSKHLGVEAKVWRDTGLVDGAVLENEIIAQLQQSAVMLSVISPRYLKSGMVAREMNEFCEHARRSGGLVVGSTQRLIPIVKTPVDGPLPPFMKDVWFRVSFRITLEDGVPDRVRRSLWGKVWPGFPQAGGSARLSSQGDDRSPARQWCWLCRKSRSSTSPNAATIASATGN